MVTNKLHHYVRTRFVTTYYPEIRSTNFYEICFESNTMVNQFLSVAFWVAITFHQPGSLLYVTFTLRTCFYFFWCAIFTFIFLRNETRINQIKNIVSFNEVHNIQFYPYWILHKTCIFCGSNCSRIRPLKVSHHILRFHFHSPYTHLSRCLMYTFN